MPRFIDADKLEKCSYVIAYKDEWHMTKYGEFVELADIENAPTADVVKVVRCEDCIHHKNAPRTLYVWCECLDGLLPREWFCADGERREDGA